MRTMAWLVAAAALSFLWPLHAQAQSETATPAGSQASAQPQTSSQGQAKKTAQPAKLSPQDSATKQTSAAAVHRANADKVKPKHVFTNDDLSGLSGGISVVGDSESGAARGSTAGSQARNAAASGDKNEAYWRQKAQAIRDQIAGVDQQIDRVKLEIAKSGPASFDPTTGLTQNVIVLHDRNAELQRLQERKQGLEKQLEELADEGRKAGANPGWFR